MPVQNEWTVLRMLEWATGYFSERDVPSPRLSIEWILSHVLNIKRLDLYMQFDRPLIPDELDTLRSLVKRRALHEPLQSITGSTSFYNAEIRVTKDVLIPRPETEELVELILNDHPDHSTLNVLDIGTGSGCIPIAINMERPEWALTGIDISDAALEVARTNNQLNKTKVNLQIGNLFDASTLPDSIWDVIVSNPPYIPDSELAGLDKQVAEFEPHIALFCTDRPDVYRSIISYAENHLQVNGTLYFELHHEHEIEHENIFSPQRWSLEILKDLGHKRRFAKAVFLG